MRFVVFGTGGAGGYFGAQLALAGENVGFIARGPHLEAIQTIGLRLETPAGETIIQPAEATDDPTQVTDVDVVILGVKAWQVTEAAQAIRPMIRPGTFIVPLQNGVEAPSELATILGAECVLGGLCGTLSWVAGPGHIRSAGGHNFIRFGELDNRRSERVERLCQAFARAGVKVEVPSDILKTLCDKFLLVTSFGGIGAITRPRLVSRAQFQKRVGYSSSAWKRWLHSLHSPVHAALRHCNETFKPSELEYWNGAVVRLGRQTGVSTPLHKFIYDCLLPQELHARSKVNFPR